MDRESASAKADELTREATESGNSESYWIEVQRPSGDWAVEERAPKRSLVRRIWDAFWESPS